MSNENGQQPTPGEIDERRKANEQETAEAHKLAAEQQRRDIEGGQKPVVTSIADSIKGKLERDDYSVFTNEDGQPVPPARDAA